VRGAAVVVVLAVVIAASVAPWKTRLTAAAEYQAPRSDLRRTMDLRDIPRGILKTRDHASFATAFDGWQMESGRVFVIDDGSGLFDVRRAHPDLPLFISLRNDDVGRPLQSKNGPQEIPPGVLLELERLWPTFLRPEGVAARAMAQDGASGNSVLWISHASPGGRVTLPFDVVVAGTYALDVEAQTGPDGGDYDLTLDGEPLLAWHGYSPQPAAVRPSAGVRALTAGRHVLVAQCTGHDPASSGYDARLDALRGVAAP
jgi:hypothetical protein